MMISFVWELSIHINANVYAKFMRNVNMRYTRSLFTLIVNINMRAWRNNWDSKDMFWDCRNQTEIGLMHIAYLSVYSTWPNIIVLSRYPKFQFASSNTRWSIGSHSHQKLIFKLNFPSINFFSSSTKSILNQHSRSCSLFRGSQIECSKFTSHTIKGNKCL